MPEHKHLRRLAYVWECHPVYFVTVCTAGRSKLLDRPDVAVILRSEWQIMRAKHGWAVGRYVIMPDHVHVFVCPENGDSTPLSRVMGKWKEWTSKRVLAALQRSGPLWQPQFFDHVLRSEESRELKWSYVRNNPVRAGLVAAAEDWPYSGSIDFE